MLRIWGGRHLCFALNAQLNSRADTNRDITVKLKQSTFLSVNQSTCLYISLPIYVSIYMYRCLSSCLSVCLSISHSIRLSILLSIHPCICLSGNQCTCTLTPICMYISMCVYIFIYNHVYIYIYYNHRRARRPEVDPKILAS